MEIKKTEIGFKGDLKNFLHQVASGRAEPWAQSRLTIPAARLAGQVLPSRTGWFNPAWLCEFPPRSFRFVGLVPIIRSRLPERFPDALVGGLLGVACGVRPQP
jgi:hypothetical protein